MRNKHSLSLKWINDSLQILNQAQLPWKEEWLSCHSPEDMHSMISHLRVRGAPLIGIAAACALAQYVEKGADAQQILKAAQYLIEARPTAINLRAAITRQLQAYEKEKKLDTIIRVAEDLFDEDIRLCQSIAEHGLCLLQSGDSILTHCNTGALVTAGIGTALGIIIHAFKNGKKVHVYVDETRPLLQGARLTAWELERAGVPYTLICDNMAASLMRAGKIQKVFVGADRIAHNGDFANKIGTYSAAVAAKFHNIPFYVAAPYTTYDRTCASGESIVIEERNPNEVRGIVSDQLPMIWTEAHTPVYNPSFDVTPAALVERYIFDSGVIRPTALP